MQNSQPKHKNSKKKWTRALLRALLYPMSAICILGIVTFFALQIRPVQDAIKQFVCQVIEKNTGTQCRIRELSGNLLAGMEIRDITLTEPGAGSPLISADRVKVSYSAPVLLTKVLWINHLELDGAAVDFVQSSDGAWNINLSRPQKTADKSEPAGVNIVIRKINILNSRVSVSQPGDSGETIRCFTAIECRASLSIGSNISWRINHLAFRLDRPDLALTDVSGYFRFCPDSGRLDVKGVSIKTRGSFLTLDGRSDFLSTGPYIDVVAGVEALTLSEIGRALSTDLPGEGIITGNLQAKGTLEKLEHYLALNLGESRVQSSGIINIDKSSGIGCDIAGSFSGLNPAAVPIAALKPLAGEINADISLKGQHLNLPDRTGRVSIDMKDSRIEGYAISRADLQAGINGDDLVFETLQVETAFGKLFASGGITGALSKQADPRMRIDGQIEGFNPGFLACAPVFAGNIGAGVNADIQIPRGSGVEAWIGEATCRFTPSRVMGIDLSGGVLDFSIHGPDIQARLEAEGLVFKQATADILSATASWRGGIKDFAVSGQCALTGLRVGGRQIPALDMNTWVTPASAQLDLNLTGGRNAHLALSADVGNWMSPVKEINLKRITLESGGRVLLCNREPARFNLSRDFLDIDALMMASNGASLGVSGRAEWVPPHDLSVTLILDDFDLDQTAGLWEGLAPVKTMAIPGFKHTEYDLGGVVAGRIKVSGDVERPIFAGDIRLKDGFLNLKKQKLTYENLSADLRLEPGVIYISDMRAAGDKEGWLSLSGSLTYDSAGPKALNLRALGENLRVPFHAGVDARITPDLSLSGEWKAPKLVGDITVTEGRVNLDRFFETRPSEIEVVRPEAGDDNVIRIPDKSPEAVSISGPLAADIRVVIPRNFWIKDRDTSIEISGEINLKKQPGRSLVLYGPLYSVRGTYRFRGKIFNITGGELNFIGQEKINPPVSIDAETRIKDVKIIMHLTGTFERLNVALDSEPAMDQAEIISYLVFGRPQDSLSEGESFSAQQAALSMTGQIAADELRDILGDGFGVDYINISAGSGDLREGSFDMGKYVSPRVFVIYRQGFTKDSPRQVQIDYEINRSFTLRTQIDEEKTSAVDLIWKHEF